MHKVVRHKHSDRIGLIVGEGFSPAGIPSYEIQVAGMRTWWYVDDCTTTVA